MIALAGGPRRFGELNRSIPDISKRMLTQCCGTWSAMGSSPRHVFPTSPPSVEYRLADLGRSLLAPLQALVEWLKLVIKAFAMPVFDSMVFLQIPKG